MIRDQSCIETLRNKGPQGSSSENRGGLTLPLFALADRATSLPDAVC